MAVVPQFSSETRCQPTADSGRGTIRIGLLGLGQVGSALARLILARPRTGGCRGPRSQQRWFAILCDHALTRGVAETCDPEAVFDTQPTVIVEALGGLEPARTLVLEAIARGIPVVTANKSLLAHHGDELLEAASRRRRAAAIRGQRHRRRAVSRARSRDGRMRRLSQPSAAFSTARPTSSCRRWPTEARDYASALSDAQRRGFAEPDPSKDVGGVDAVEKLTILIRQFAGLRVDPGAIETAGIERITSDDLAGARGLGGTLKPVVHAEGIAYAGGATPIAAFAGPAFVRDEHPLARVHQAGNGLCLRAISGSQMCFTGPGAGPDATAITMLDDVLEAASPSRHFPCHGLPRALAWSTLPRRGGCCA